MKDLLVPQCSTNGGNNHTKSDYQQDALLGFPLHIPHEHADASNMLQLQESGHSLTHSNSISSSSNSSINYHHHHQSLLNCVDVLPSMHSAAALTTVNTALLPENRTISGQNTNGNVMPATQLNNNNNNGSPFLDNHQQFIAGDVAAAVSIPQKNCDSLAKLAFNLWRLAKDDHIVIDRKRNEVIRTDSVTNQVTIYRCMDPINMGMRQSSTAISDPNPPSKVGRPRKRSAPSPSDKNNIIAPQAKKIELQEIKNNSNNNNSTELNQRTRYGRMVKSSFPQNQVQAKSEEIINHNDSETSQLRDKDYRCNNHTMTVTATPEKVSSEQPDNRQPRTVPANAICPGCNKIFLGRRLQRHYVKFPNHMARGVVRGQPEQQNIEDATLFGLFTARLQRHTHLSEEQRADLFLHELNDFVEQLQLRSTRLIRNTSGLHFVNARIARVLGIPEGQYALDMSAMESAQAPVPEPEPTQCNAVTNTRNLVDYTGLSMSLDDTLTDEAAQRLNLSAGGKLLPPSEESLLRNVSDLMQPPPVAVPVTVGNGHGHGAGNVNGVGGNDVVGVTAILPHYENASDNAVEALTMKETPNAAILDLNVEYFQFNNN